MANDCVSVRRLQQIAIGTALTHGLKAPSREEISRMYFGKGQRALPIIVPCDAGCVWVDRYYVAYQIGDDDIRYTYVTKTHILEEVASYRLASKERSEDIHIPEDVAAEFKKAQMYMRKKGVEVWIAQPWRDEKKFCGEC